MINGIVAFIAKSMYGKQLLQLVDRGNSALTGNRSEIIAGLLVVTAVLQHLGIIPADQAKQIEALLGGMLPVTMAEKIGNVLEQADRILPPPPVAGDAPPKQ